MAHVILFEHRNFHGAHKHVFMAEANLNASDDSFFNDRTSSIVVLEGQWAFYRDANFQNIDGILGVGLYPSVVAAGIDNDRISSLRPLGIIFAADAELAQASEELATVKETARVGEPK